MSVDIEQGIPLLPPSNSSSEVDLYDRRHYGTTTKVHKGYGSSRRPLPSSAGTAAAGEEFQQIFEGHIGTAAADKGNPLGAAIFKGIYGDPIESVQIWREAEHHGLKQYEYKPENLKWNKETKKQFPRHWKIVREERDNQGTDKNTSATARPKTGLVLPFSRNIGPGNTVQEAKTGADKVAQGHDLHYKYAKSNEEIFDADREAVGEFIKEATNSKDPISQVQAVIGAVGLQVKTTVEKVIGKPLYGKYATQTETTTT